MANTYTLISSNTLSSSAASVTFSSIPATYTDLVLRMSVRSDIADSYVNIYVSYNGNASNYSETYMAGNGTSAVSGRGSANPYFLQAVWSEGTSWTSNTFASSELYIPNYAGSANKVASAFGAAENNATAARVTTTATLWSNTSAISSINLQPYSGNFVSGSSFYLYGIKNS
jgi:hypothetical protein